MALCETYANMLADSLAAESQHWGGKSGLIGRSSVESSQQEIVHSGALPL